MGSILHILLGAGTRPGLGIAFLGAAAVIVFAGIKLSRYGDALGERTGLGAGLVGMLFLAGVTSLPELAVSTTSTLNAFLRAAELAAGEGREALLAAGADLAMGNMIGSNVFNLMLIAVMDLVYRRGALVCELSQKHILTAAGGLGMLGVVLFGMAVERTFAVTLPGIGTGCITPLLPVAYLVLMTLQSRLDTAGQALPGDEVGGEPAADDVLVRMSRVRFYGALVCLAGLIVVCGVWLSLLGDRIALPADQGGFGLGQSFVGTFFLAVSTSLPELVICVASVRLGFLNMAAGNVFGSNMFNLVILFTADMGLRGGSILHHASLSHLVTMAMVMVLTTIAVVSLMVRSKRDVGKMGLDAWLMLALYVAGNVVVYLVG